MRNCVLFGMWLAICAAQTKIDLRTQTRTPDFSAMSGTKPIHVGSSLPAACGTGELFFVTTAASGQNLYGCSATNVWTPLGSGIGGACSLDANGSLVCPHGLITGDGSQPGELRLYPKVVSGSSYVSWLSPDILPLTYRLRLPSDAPVSGQMLAFSGVTNETAAAYWTSALSRYATSVYLPPQLWTAPVDGTGAVISASVISFAEKVTRSVVTQTLLPSRWDNGTSTAVALIWTAPSATEGQTVAFSVSAACATDESSMTSPLWVTAPTAVSTVTSASSGGRRTTRISSLPLTGCLPGSTVFLRVTRSNADTAIGDVNLWGAEFSYTRLIE